MFEDDVFDDLMQTTVTVAKAASIDKYAAVSFGSPVAYLAHVTYKQRRSASADGREVNEIGRIYFRGIVDVNQNDQVTIIDPQGYPVVVQVISSNARYDEDGPHHTSVAFGAESRIG